MKTTINRRIRASVALAVLAAPATLVASGTAHAGAPPQDITSCSFSPSEFTWESQDDVVAIPINATPEGGVSAFSATVKPDGGSETVMFDNFGNTSNTPPNGSDVVDGMGATYDSLLEALGGQSGTVYLAIYLPSATSIDDTPLCEAVIHIVAPGSMPETGSQGGLTALVAMLLLAAGVPLVTVSRRRATRIG